VGDQKKGLRDEMSTFRFEANPASAEEAIAGSGGIQGTEAGMPMSEDHMEREFTQYPWEATAPEFRSEDSVVIAPDRMSIVTVTLQRAREIAREHIERASERIPEEEAREGFVRGAGMFDFPAPPADLDDQLT
jgi:hypothetical protein